jgi:hypothetical protein
MNRGERPASHFTLGTGGEAAKICFEEVSVARRDQLNRRQTERVGLPPSEQPLRLLVPVDHVPLDVELDERIQSDLGKRHERTLAPDGRGRRNLLGSLIGHGLVSSRTCGMVQFR